MGMLLRARALRVGATETSVSPSIVPQLELDLLIQTQMTQKPMLRADT